VRELRQSVDRVVEKIREEREKGLKEPYKGPETEFIKIPNQFIEAVYSQTLGHNQSSVLWYLVRKTWGWQKRSEFIRVTDMARGLKMGKNRASEALSSLKKRRIVTVNRNKTYGIQIDVSLWRDLYRKPEQKNIGNRNKIRRNRNK